MMIFERTVLKALESCGGEARYEDICRTVGAYVTLTEEDKKESSPGLPAYWIRIKLCLRKLVESGEIQEIEPKLFILTKQGKRTVAE